MVVLLLQLLLQPPLLMTELRVCVLLLLLLLPMAGLVHYNVHKPDSHSSMSLLSYKKILLYKRVYAAVKRLRIATVATHSWMAVSQQSNVSCCMPSNSRPTQPEPT
jgi:hypothetical protein